MRENKELHQEKPYRVLTIDGGGMRGLYSATVLDTLSRRFACQTDSEQLDIGKGFDLIVGTSTGGSSLAPWRQASIQVRL